MSELLFDVVTPLGFNVRCTEAYWTFIVTHKHPVLKGQEEQIWLTLRQPDEVRRSRYDENVHLLYRKVESRWLCAVVRIKEGTGFLITAYPTDAVKAGEIIWKSSK